MKNFILTLRSDFKRSLLSWAFIAAIIVTVVVFWVGIINSVLRIYSEVKQTGCYQSGMCDELMCQSLCSDAMLLCVPIIAALPFTTAFVDDLKSGFIKHSLTRTSFFSYTVSKTVCCAISGGLALFIGVLIGEFTLKLVIAPIDIVPTYEGYEPMFHLSQTFTFLLMGMLFAIVGMLMSVATMNKYMAYASPFIFYYVLVIMAERYFRKIYVLNPKNYLSGAGSWDLGVTSIYITLGLLIIATALIFYPVAQKRLRN